MQIVWVFLFLVSWACSGDVIPTMPGSSIPISSDSTITTITPNVPVNRNVPYGSARDESWAEEWKGVNFYGSNYWNSHQDTTAFRYGWSSEKITVSAGECFGSDCQRTPVYERKEFTETGLAVDGDEFWYGWSFYVPLESANPWVYFGQIMMPPDDESNVYAPLWMFLKQYQQPFCMVFDPTQTQNRSCGSPSSNNITLISDQQFAGKWHDIVLHIKYSQTQGLTEVWVDGELKGKYEGYTLRSGRKGAYFKYGVYRIAAEKPTIVYYDEVRKGKTREEVDIRLLTANR